MGLFQDILYNIKNGKKTITEPIFMKDFTEENENLKKLLQIKSLMAEADVVPIEKEVRAIKYGLKGEKTVAFELRNSLIPSLILHDIRLTDADTNNVAQFDFIVICSTCVFVFEAKHLSGEIQVNENDEFFRVILDADGKFVRKEGMYSPVEQNERHIRLLQVFLKKNAMKLNVPIKSAIIITNSKSVIKKKFASEEVQNKLYKVDQVVNLLQKEVQSYSSNKLLESEMKELATLLIKNDRPLVIDYERKYNVSIEVTEDKDALEEVNISNDAKLIEALKKFRMNASAKHQLKPYMVFTNNEMDSLISTKPTTKEEMLKVKGFGEKKVELYGEEIIRIIKNT
ncbi:NERD domain-containing protein [Bacillus sp. NPDC094106]|uniref:NERD domain-containing protein n=1 Tax=Bacillus sp. NPDC094106 TaxID=3363949 RepID=UPI003810B39C